MKVQKETLNQVTWLHTVCFLQSKRKKENVYMYMGINVKAYVETEWRPKHEKVFAPGWTLE